MTTNGWSNIAWMMESIGKGCGPIGTNLQRLRLATYSRGQIILGRSGQ
jgi:hypothetical protein